MTDSIDIEAIRCFWRWFEKQHPRPVAALDMRGSPQATEATQELHAALAAVKPGLAFLLGPARGEEAREFFITADSRKDLIPWVLALVEWSPEIAGMLVKGFRPRLELSAIQFRGATLRGDDLFFRAFQLPGDEIGITLHVPEMTDQNRAVLSHLAVLLLDHLLGEYDSMTMIDSLVVDPLPADHTALTGFAPFEMLRQFIDARKMKQE